MEEIYGRHFRYFFFILLVCGLTWFLFPENEIYPAESSSRRLKVAAGDEMITVDLKNALLGDVLREIVGQSKIRFTVHESLLGEKVSVEFDPLPLQEGLRRILASLDYSLVVDKEGRVSEVVILGKGKTSGSRAKESGGSSEPVGGSQREEEPTNSEELFEVIQNAPPPGGTVRSNNEEHKDFKIIKNAPAPGGRGKVSDSDADEFKIIKNAPPPED